MPNLCFIPNFIHALIESLINIHGVFIIANSFSGVRDSEKLNWDSFQGSYIWVEENIIAVEMLNSEMKMYLIDMGKNGVSIK
jgi:hypothetical protein